MNFLSKCFHAIHIGMDFADRHHAALYFLIMLIDGYKQGIILELRKGYMDGRLG